MHAHFVALLWKLKSNDKLTFLSVNHKEQISPVIYNNYLASFVFRDLVKGRSSDVHHFIS